MKLNETQKNKMDNWTQAGETPQHLLLKHAMYNGMSEAELHELELILEYAVRRERQCCQARADRLQKGCYKD